MKYISKVLLYNVDDIRLSLIKNFFAENNIEYINVRKQDYLKTIASLLELEDSDYQTYMEKGFTEEMAVLFNFDNDLLDCFLNYFKDNRIPGIRLKAIFTPTNTNWNSIELYEELTKEANYYKQK